VAIQQDNINESETEATVLPSEKPEKPEKQQDASKEEISLSDEMVEDDSEEHEVTTRNEN